MLYSRESSRSTAQRRPGRATARATNEGVRTRASARECSEAPSLARSDLYETPQGPGIARRRGQRPGECCRRKGQRAQRAHAPSPRFCPPVQLACQRACVSRDAVVGTTLGPSHALSWDRAGLEICVYLADSVLDLALRRFVQCLPPYVSPRTCVPAYILPVALCCSRPACPTPPALLFSLGPPRTHTQRAWTDSTLASKCRRNVGQSRTRFSARRRTSSSSLLLCTAQLVRHHAKKGKAPRCAAGGHV